MSSVLEEMKAVLEGDEETLFHYGTKFHSGRYPYGSGDQPFQHEGDFLTRIERLRKEGWVENAENVKKEFGLSLEDYRNEKAWANYTRREQEVARAKSLKEKGLGNSAIGKEMGIPESSVRSLLNPNAEAKMQAAKKTADFLKAQVDAKGMIDVGKDAERYIVINEGDERGLGVSRTKLDQALYALEAEGYVVHQGRVEQPTNRGNWTTQVVLCPPGTPHKEIWNTDKIHTIEDYHSSDNGESFQKKFKRDLSQYRIPVTGSTTECVGVYTKEDFCYLTEKNSKEKIESAIEIEENLKAPGPSKECLLISWLQSPSAVILEPLKIV